MDAVKELADGGRDGGAAGPIRARPHGPSSQASLHDVMAAAQDWFKANLVGRARCRTARAYLNKRGIGQNSASVRLRLAPDDRQGIDDGAQAKFDREMLVEAGLLIKVEDKEPYARFRGRLMLPIHDPRERIIGFGGRILDASVSGCTQISEFAGYTAVRQGPHVVQPAPRRAGLAQDRPAGRGRRLHGRDRARRRGHRGRGRPARHGADRNADRTALAAGR